MLGGYWTRLRKVSNKKAPIDTPANIVLLLTSYLNRAALKGLYDELRSEEVTITLPLIAIYPASCDVAMSGVDVAFDALCANPDDELFMTVLHTWKRMLDLNIALPDSLQSNAYDALMKCNSNSKYAVAFFIEHLFDPCAKAPKWCGYNNYHNDVRSLLVHFNMDATLVDLVIKRWIKAALSSDVIGREKFQAMRVCLTFDQYTPPPAADHSSYPSYQAAASRFYDEILAYLTANSDLVAKVLTERILNAACHYQLDTSCVKLVPLLQHANLSPSALIPILRLVNSVYDLIPPPDQASIHPEDHCERIAWTSLASLLPDLVHWEPALFGIDMCLAALTASPSNEQAMSLLRSWKQLLDWGVPGAASIPLIQTTVDILVTKYDSTVCMEPAIYFIEQLYRLAANLFRPSPAPFYLHKLLFHCNMDSSLVDAFLDKWRSCRDIALVEVKCACLCQCLFKLEIKMGGSTAAATYVLKTDPTRYLNHVNAYSRIVEEMLVCFRLKPALILKYANTFLLQGISHYMVEARCLPGLTTVIKDAKLDKQVHDSLLKCIPDKYKVDVKAALPLAVKYSNATQMHWLKLQKALSNELRANLSAHRKLLLGKVSSGTTAEAVLDALASRDELDMYLNNLYCIDEDDADLSLLLEFTALCERLPMPKVTALVSALSEVPIAPSQLKQAYYRLVHRSATKLCDLSPFPLKLVYGRATFANNSSSFYSESVQFVLNYLGFTIDVLVDNILAGRSVDTLTEEAYNKADLALLCPIDSELEPPNITHYWEPSSGTNWGARLTAASKATRIKLFERFVRKWREALAHESFDKLLEGNVLYPAASKSFQLLSLIGRLDHLRTKLRSLPPATDNKYALQEPPARLPVGVLVFLQGTHVSTTMSPKNENDLPACRALADSIKQELSETDLKDAIDVRPIKHANGKLCVSLTKVYVTTHEQCRSFSTLIHNLLTEYAKTKLQSLPNTADPAQSEQLKQLAELTLADFIAGRFFPTISPYSTGPVRSHTLSTTSSSSPPAPAAAPSPVVIRPGNEQHDPQLQYGTQPIRKRTATTTLPTSTQVLKRVKSNNKNA